MEIRLSGIAKRLIWESSGRTTFFAKESEMRKLTVVVLLAGFLVAGCEPILAAYPWRKNKDMTEVRKTSEPFEGFVWLSEPPADCPFEKSTDIVGIKFTGRNKAYTDADTWYPSWASDGHLYSPFADGEIVKTWSDGSLGIIRTLCGLPDAEHARTGHAKIVGDDPMNLEVIALGTYLGKATPYASRYPSGSLVHNGIWYYGTHVEYGFPPGSKWPAIGPFVGFRISRDFGKTWTDTPWTPTKSIFGESSLDEKGKPNGRPVKIGEPFFVDFGKNMEHSPDGKAYLLGHGAVEPDPKPRPGNLSWINGDQVYMLRVKPSPQNINDPKKYEFFAGHDMDGEPIWTRDFAKIKPLIDWNNHCGHATMTYNPYLKKYLMCITEGYPNNNHYDTFIIESDKITGPWKLVTYMKKFGEQGYCFNIPSKFISKDGRTAWLCYSANYTPEADRAVPFGANPPGSRYGMNLQEIELMAPKK